MPGELVCGAAASRFEVSPRFPLVWLLGNCYSAYGLGDWMPSVNQNDDAVLLRATSGGDKSAFQILYERHGSVLFGLALKILNDHADAEDVLQEVFVQIWKTAGTFDQSRAKPLGWLIMLTRSRAIDRLRSRKTSARAVDAASLEPGADAVLPDEMAGAAEEHLSVRRAVQELPEEQRMPIELAYFGGMSQTEIASHLGQPLGTVKTRIRSGMIRLRERWGVAS